MDKVSEWNEKQVIKWISTIFNSSKFIDIFKFHKINGKQLLTLTDDEIKNEMNIIDKNDFSELKKKIGELKIRNKHFISSLLVIPDELKCPLTKQLMDDPVMADDGYFYDQLAIEEYMKVNKVSPVTGEQFESENLMSNRNIKKKIEQFKKENNLEIQ